MAGEEHNQTLRHIRGLARNEAAIPPLALLGIWRVYKYPDEVMKQLWEEVDQFDVLRFREDEVYRKNILQLTGHSELVVRERPAISDAEAGVVMNDDDIDE
ncbi:hypothetical protein, partial [Eubacterium aggregans]|uniref:hypothetical protein n=1 Tax=Eubacterium aggregans TaxID=81409 RepID=UPI003F300B82